MRSCRESHPASKATDVTGDDSPKAWGNGCPSKGEREDMTASPPVKGGTGVKPNCSWVKTRRTARVELTENLESPGNGSSHHMLWCSVSAGFPANDLRATLGKHWEWVSKGWFRFTTKGKKHRASLQAPRAAEAGFSCEPQTSLMRLVINKDLVREGGADHWPRSKSTGHALGSDHKSRQSASNSIFHLSSLLFFTFHYPLQSHVTS